jgi:hypothetical protein
MLNVFPQLEDLAISHSWGGFADITMNRAPDIGRIGSNIYYLQGFSGHGLAFTGMAGNWQPKPSQARLNASTCFRGSGICRFQEGR